MITIEELKKACTKPYPKEYEKNAQECLKAFNVFRKACGIPMTPSYFYRDVEYEKSKGRSGKSDHTRCLACDFIDRNGRLKQWVKDNEEAVKAMGIYVEHPDYTPTWLHLTIAKKSRTLFKPY